MGLLTMKQPYGVAPVEDRLGWMTDASCAKPRVSSIWDHMDEAGQVWVCSYCPVVGERVSRRRESRNRNKRDGREVTA